MSEERKEILVLIKQDYLKTVTVKDGRSEGGERKEKHQFTNLLDVVIDADDSITFKNILAKAINKLFKAERRRKKKGLPSRFKSNWPIQFSLNEMRVGESLPKEIFDSNSCRSSTIRQDLILRNTESGRHKFLDVIEELIEEMFDDEQITWSKLCSNTAMLRGKERKANARPKAKVELN